MLEHGMCAATISNLHFTIDMNCERYVARSGVCEYAQCIQSHTNSKTVDANRCTDTLDRNRNGKNVFAEHATIVYIN